MSCLRQWITQFNCLTANLKYAGKHSAGVCLGKMLIEQVQKFSLYTFLPTMSWAVCSFSFLGDVAFIHMEEEALKGHGGPVAWEKRSSKSLQVWRDRDPGNSKGLMAVLCSFFLKGGSGEFCLVSWWSCWLLCVFDRTTYFDVTLCFSEQPYQHVIFCTFFLDLRHLCPCVQYTLCSSLLFHVYHTSSFPHSHIIYQKGDFLAFERGVNKDQMLPSLMKELDFLYQLWHAPVKKKSHECGRYSEVLVFSRWKVNTRHVVRFAHGKPLEAAFSSGALDTLGRLLAARHFWLAPCHAVPRVRIALEAAQC